MVPIHVLFDTFLDAARLERFLPDLMHAGLLGTAKCHNGSILTFLIEGGCFGELGRGEYEHVMKARLRQAYKEFKDWCREHQLRVVQPRFTPARLHRKSRVSFPVLSSKAIPGKSYFFLAIFGCKAMGLQARSFASGQSGRSVCLQLLCDVAETGYVSPADVS